MNYILSSVDKTIKDNFVEQFWTLHVGRRPESTLFFAIYWKAKAAHEVS